MFQFLSTRAFEESLGKLDPLHQIRVKEKLRFFAGQKNPLIFAKMIKGKKNYFRFRVGDFRILFLISKQHIYLLEIGDRKEIYKGW